MAIEVKLSISASFLDNLPWEPVYPVVIASFRLEVSPIGTIWCLASKDGSLVLKLFSNVGLKFGLFPSNLSYHLHRHQPQASLPNTHHHKVNKSSQSVKESLDLACHRFEPSLTMDPQIRQETELLTFSPIIGGPPHSPMLKKNHGYFATKHSQLRRRSPTFLSLKYGFVIFVIASSVATLCDIDRLKEENYDRKEEPQEITSDSNNSSTLIEASNATIVAQYRKGIHHKMKIPLYIYMAVSLAILFLAIFGRTMENALVPFIFAMFMLLLIGIMVGLSVNETEFGLGYSWYLWTIYILHVLFSLSFTVIILMMNHFT